MAPIIMQSPMEAQFDLMQPGMVGSATLAGQPNILAQETVLPPS